MWRNVYLPRALLRCRAGSGVSVSDKPVDILVQEVLSKTELERLRDLFGATDAEWPVVLDALVAAAIAEYADAFLASGQTMSQAIYIQQQRLRQLMQRGAFQGSVPTEEQVARVFHHNPSGAQALLRNVLARFDVELTSNRKTTLAKELRKAKRSKDDVVTIYIGSSSVSDGFQKILDTANESGAKPFPLERIARDPTVHSRWKIPFDSYEFLCKQLNVPLADRSPD